MWMAVPLAISTTEASIGAKGARGQHSVQQQSRRERERGREVEGERGRGRERGRS
jgi:hypothetical protein